MIGFLWYSRSTKRWREGGLIMSDDDDDMNQRLGKRSCTVDAARKKTLQNKVHMIFFP